MTKMGQEVTPGKTPPPVELPQARLRRSRHVLDLRQPRPEPPPPAPAVQRKPAAPASVGKVGGAQGKSAVPAGVGSDTGTTEDRDSVRRPAADLPAAPTEEKGHARSRESGVAAEPAKKIKKKWWPFGKRAKQPKLPRKRLTGKQLAIQALKLAIVLAGTVGFLSLGISLAERFIGIYFVVAVVYAIDSQRTFLVALVFLVMVAVWSALGNSVSAEDYAIYAFYFLVIGLLSAIREMITTKTQPET